MGYRYAEAEEITICEYSYEMYAWNLRTIEEHRQINMLAWQINQASAEKKQGKKIVPAFKSFDEFDKTKTSLENLKRGYGDTKAQKILEKKTDLIELLRQANSGGA